MLKETIVLLREAGGYGDQLCIGGAARQLRHEGWTGNIVVAAPAEYESIVQHLDGVSGFWNLGRQAEIFPQTRPRNGTLDPSKHPYLARLFAFADPSRVVDLWCPAWIYETTEIGQLRFGRPQLFAMAAGCKDITHSRPVWRVQEADKTWARNWLATWTDTKAPLVGVAFRATGPERCYPTAYTRPLLEGLAQKCNVVVLDQFSESPRHLRCVHLKNEPVDRVAAVVALCNFVISVDSFILHLAGALGTRIFGLFGPTEPSSTLAVYPGSLWTDFHSLCYYSDRNEPCCYSEKRGWRPRKSRDGGDNPKCCSIRGCKRMCALIPELIIDGVSDWLG